MNDTQTATEDNAGNKEAVQSRQVKSYRERDWDTDGPIRFE